MSNELLPTRALSAAESRILLRGAGGAGHIGLSVRALPVVIPVSEFRDLVGSAVTATLSGADPAAELKKAHEQFRPILERSEKA